MTKFYKKPEAINAIQWTGKNDEELKTFTRDEFYRRIVDFGTTFASIKTLEGCDMVTQYDWVIKDEEGKIYVCDPEEFKITYLTEQEYAVYRG